MTWDAQRILDLLDALRVRRGDSTLVEAKRAMGGLPSDTATSVCAFANMPDGGTILLGIDEAGGEFNVTGVAKPAEMEAALVNQARSSVTPVPFINTYTREVEGKQVVVAEVSPLSLIDKPATVGGRAYLRQADGDFAMHPHELRMIEVEKLHISEQLDYDRQAVNGLTSEDLVPQLVTQYLASVRLRDRRLQDRDDNEILRRTGVLLATGEPTLAGLYAMGDYPQGQFPSLTVTAAVQLNSTESGGTRNLDLQQFTGPIPVLLEDLMDWCRRNLLSVRAYREDGHMEERPEIPLRAVRELIANALVHRDLGPNTLGTGKGIQVRLTPTNLFVLSPGGLRGVSIEQLESEDHAQAAVNQRLYSISQKLVTSDGASIIEGEGGGIREVLQAAREYGLRPPALVNTGVQFKAMVWRPESTRAGLPEFRWHTISEKPRTKSDASLHPKLINPLLTGKNTPKVLRALAQQEPATFKDLKDSTGLTVGQVRYALNDLLATGLIEMDGGQGDKTTVYRVAAAYASFIAS